MRNRQEVLQLLDREKIPYRLAEHPAVFTIEEMQQLHLEGEQQIAKNLFLRDDKKRAWYLLVLRAEKHADLKKLRSLLGSRPLSFAGEADLGRLLGLEKGAVTPLGALNDEEHRVVIRIDSEFCGQTIGVHPLQNTATVWLAADDLITLLKKYGSDAAYIDLQA